MHLLPPSGPKRKKRKKKRRYFLHSCKFISKIKICFILGRRRFE
jgi:hypothetical protein